MYNVYAIWLVFSGVATVLQDCLDPPGHRLGQVPQVLAVAHLGSSGLQDMDRKTWIAGHG